MNNIFVLFKKMSLLIIIFIVIIGFYFFRKKQQDSFGLSLANFQVFVIKNHLLNNSQLNYKLVNDDIFGEMVVVPAEKDVAEILTKSFTSSVKSSYTDRAVPYGGHITSQLTCPSQKYVSERYVFYNSQKTPVIMAIANGRRIMGECSIDQIKYITAVWAGYSEYAHKLVTVRLYKPIRSVHSIEEDREILFHVLKKIF